MKVKHCPYVLWHYRLPTYKLLSQKLNNNFYVDYCVVEKDLVKNFKPDSSGFKNKKTIGLNIWGWSVFFSFAPIKSAISKRYDTLLLEWNIRNLSLLPTTIIARYLGKRVIWWGHGVPKKDKGIISVFHFLAGRMLPDSVIVYVSSAQKILIENKGFASEQVFVAPNAVDVRSFMDSLNYYNNNKKLMDKIKNDYGIRDNIDYLIYSGRLLNGRDLDRILFACKELNDNGLHVGVIFIGDGEYRQRLENLALSLNINEKVVFTGALLEIHSVAPFYILARVCVIPGWLGLTLTQASGMGLPSIVCDNPNLHNPEIQIFENKKTGLFYSYKKNDLKDRIKELLADRIKLKEYGQNAQSLVEQCYSTEIMVNGILEACYDDKRKDA